MDFDLLPEPVHSAKPWERLLSPEHKPEQAPSLAQTCLDQGPFQPWLISVHWGPRSVWVLWEADAKTEIGVEKNYGYGE